MVGRDGTQSKPSAFDTPLRAIRVTALGGGEGSWGSLLPIFLTGSSRLLGGRPEVTCYQLQAIKVEVAVQPKIRALCGH